MVTIGTYNKVIFNSVEELTDFVKDFVGDAYFWNGWTGDVYPIMYDDDKEIAVIGSDAWTDVEEAHLRDIYAYVKTNS